MTSLGSNPSLSASLVGRVGLMRWIQLKNADFNASENILKRVVSTVLRNELLKKNKLGNGTYEPKNLKKEKVKEVLLSFSYNYNNSWFIIIKKLYNISFV